MTTTHKLPSQGLALGKGAMVVANLTFIMKDPAHFRDPHTFNPTRFLDAKGRFVKEERIVPFGIGKRACMGEPLARNEVFLFFVSLVQKLRFLPPRGHPNPDPGQYSANWTNIPRDFYVRIEPVL